MECIQADKGGQGVRSDVGHRKCWRDASGRPCGPENSGAGRRGARAAGSAPEPGCAARVTHTRKVYVITIPCHSRLGSFIPDVMKCIVPTVLGWRVMTSSTSPTAVRVCPAPAVPNQISTWCAVAISVRGGSQSTHLGPGKRRHVHEEGHSGARAQGRQQPVLAPSALLLI